MVLSHAAYTIIVVLQYASLMILPIISFLYSFGCSILVYVAGEYTVYSLKVKIMDLIVPVIFRSIFIVVYYFLGNKYHLCRSDDDDTVDRKTIKHLIIYFILLVISIRLSYKLFKNTKYTFVDGGPDPTVTVGDNASTTTSNRLSSMFFDSDENLVIVITGANAGIGKETALQLALLATQRKHGATATTTIILGCRTVSKGSLVRDEILHELRKQKMTSNRNSNNADSVIIEVLPIELCSFQSIRTAVTTLINQHPTIHCLINNAGVMMKDHVLTSVDQNETTIQANHLGHFLLTCLLLPYIVPNDEYNKRSNIQYVPRILNVTSSTYTMIRQLPMDDLNCTNRKYELFNQYAISKLCNILFSYSLGQQYPSIFTASIHPGIVRTAVVRNMPWYLQSLNRIFGIVVEAFQKTPRQGSWCTVYVAAMVMDCSPANSGKYWCNRQVQPIVYPYVENDSTQLWYESCKLVHLTSDEIHRIENIATNGLQKRNNNTKKNDSINHLDHNANNNKKDR